MPPASRGERSQSGSTLKGRSAPPTLKPFLDNLPPPSLLSPKKEALSSTDNDVFEDTPTPTKPLFDLAPPDEDDEDGEDEEEDGGEEDDEFESHYSRKSSSASSGELRDTFEEEEEEDTVEDQASATEFSGTGLGPMHRVSSLPLSPKKTLLG